MRFVFPSFLPTIFAYVLSQKVTLADLFYIPYGDLLPVAGSNVLDIKPNVARCVEFFSNKIFDFDVRELSKVGTARPALPGSPSRMVSSL